MRDDAVLLANRPVRRMGFGAMQLPGPGVFGPPKDRGDAVAVIRRAVDAGVNHIDTAQFYGPGVANELIHEALHPYPKDLVVVSKVGAARNDQGHWLPAQRPEELRKGVEANLASLQLDQVPVVNLRRHPDSDVPLAEQLEAMVSLRDEGLIGGIGLSNVGLEEYRSARSRTEVACVQNAYNLADRSDQGCSTPAAPTECLTCRSSHSDRLSMPRTRSSARPPSTRRPVASTPRPPRSRSPGCCTRPHGPPHPGDVFAGAPGGEPGRRRSRLDQEAIDTLR